MHRRGSVIARPNPAVATGFTYTVVGTEEVEVLAVSFLLTADGNPANRVPFLRFLDQTGATFARSDAGFNLTATNASQYTFATGIQQYGANNAAAIGTPIPRLRLKLGESVQVGITAVQAGDALTVPRLYVVEHYVRPPYDGDPEWDAAVQSSA